MNPEELLAKAQDALRRNHPLAAVNERIAAHGYTDFNTLSQRVSRERDKKARGPTKFSDLARAAGMGATWGGLGEGVAAVRTGMGAAESGVPPTGEAFEAARAGVEDPYEEFKGRHPTQSLLAELAGGLFTGGAAASLLKPATGVLRSAGRAVATGAASGAVSGALHAEPGDRLPSAKEGGLFGGALGLVPGAVAGAARLFRPAARPILAAVVKDAPVVSKRLDGMRTRLREWSRGPDGYGGLPDVTVTGAPEFFSQPVVQSMVTRAERLKLIGSLPRPSPDGVYTFQALQAVKEELDDAITAGFAGGRNKLSLGLKEVRDDLVALIEQAVPGYKAKNAIYSEAMDRQRALVAGLKAGKNNPDPAEVRYAASNLNDEALKEFRYGFAAGVRPKIPESEVVEAAQKTAGSLLSPFGIFPAIGRAAVRAAGGGKAVRRAERLIPDLFRGKELDEVLRLMSPGAGQRALQTAVPAVGGLLREMF